MATIFRDQNGRGIDQRSRASEKAKCGFCGDRSADATWWTYEGDFHICYPCAIQALPAMIADALRAQPNAGRQLIETQEKMNAAFWRAAALALARQPARTEAEEFEFDQVLERAAFETSANGEKTP